MRSSFLFAGALAAFLAAVLGGRATAIERTGDPAKWSSFWNALMPVFTHARCLNCHGATDPVAGDNHGGGPGTELPDFFCIGCHTANTVVVPGRCVLTDTGSTLSRPDGTTENAKCVPGEDQAEVRVPVGPVWDRTGPNFTEKNTSELCLKVKDLGPQGLLDHVTTDPLIGFAFEGRRAIDSQSPFAGVNAEPPPLDRAAFAGLLTRWITEAAMACSIDGTVDLADNTTIDMAQSPFGGASTRKSVDAKIEIKNGVATSTLRYKEESTSAATLTTPGCRTTDNAEVRSTAEGNPETKFQIDMGPGGVYRMSFFLGSIEAQTNYSAKADLCRPLRKRSGKLPAEPTAEQEFSVEGQAERDPRDGSVWILKGSTPVANKGFALPGVTSRSQRTVTWDIVIR